MGSFRVVGWESAKEGAVWGKRNPLKLNERENYHRGLEFLIKIWPTKLVDLFWQRILKFRISKEKRGELRISTQAYLLNINF